MITYHDNITMPLIYKIYMNYLHNAGKNQNYVKRLPLVSTKRSHILNPLSASVASDLLCKLIDWFLYEGNSGT